MSNPTGDAADDQTGRFVPQPNGRPRPLSPHLQTWRWHITMTASILFRVTIAGSPLGLLVGFGLTVVLFSLLLNGGRHLINDTGAGLTITSADRLSSISVYGPVPLAILFWVALFATGRVSL